MAEYVFDFDRFEEPDLGTGMREAVVRRRDCKHYASGCECGKHPESRVDFVPDGFCAWGERRGAR